MIYNIKTGNYSTLHQIAVDVPHGEDIRELVDGMRQVLSTGTGIGIAAPQVGISKRVVLMNLNGFMGIIINPVITNWSGKVKNSVEGCLSFPKKKTSMKRDNLVVVEGFDENWNPIKKKCRALTAFCIQHEIDHLNGETI